MRYVAAYCLAVLQGSEPSVKDIEKILASVGIDCNSENAKMVVDELKGKKLEDIIAAGKGKLGSVPMPSGGGRATVAGGAVVAPKAATAPEAKKEEKKEEPEEESDEDMGFGLFD